MKKIILVLAFLVIAGSANAAFYIVDQSNNVVSMCDYNPSKADLASRNEIAIYSNEKIPLDKAEYRGGKIVEHKDTALELSDKDKLSQLIKEEDILLKRMRKLACDDLEKEGITFKQLKCSDFK